MNKAKTPVDADVIIVGAGPVGQMLALQLGQKGHRVIVIERHKDLYPLSRAATFDDEIARILSSVGIDADNDPEVEHYNDWYELKNGKDEVLARYDWRGKTKSGWHRMYWFHQPDLERRFAKLITKLPSVSVRRGIEALVHIQDKNKVTLTCRDKASGTEFNLHAKYLIGADGANSKVRIDTGLSSIDLGFQYDWLIVDIKPLVPMDFNPKIFQVCDPARPSTVIPGGPGRRRWEFMLMPGETPEQMESPDVVWKLLGKWGVTPDNAILERHVVWRFQARWSEKWQNKRVFIAGDAAHLMPPFAGQGMCAGLRDAINLSWKLDHVLSGIASDTLLSTYGEERKAHVSAFINLSVEIGREVCVTDPAEASTRDKVMKKSLAKFGPKPAVEPNLSLGNGVWISGQAVAGKLSPQGNIRFGATEGRFDSVFHRGWVAIGNNIDPIELLTNSQRAQFMKLKGRAVQITDSVDRPGVFDLDKTYESLFAETGCDIILIRPDYYVAAATSSEDFPDVFDDVISLIGFVPKTSLEECTVSI